MCCCTPSEREERKKEKKKEPNSQKQNIAHIAPVASIELSLPIVFIASYSQHMHPYHNQEQENAPMTTVRSASMVTSLLIISSKISITVPMNLSASGKSNVNFVLMVNWTNDFDSM